MLIIGLECQPNNALWKAISFYYCIYCLAHMSQSGIHVGALRPMSLLLVYTVLPKEAFNILFESNIYV